MSLNDVIFQITVNLNAPGVTRAGFGRVLILGDNVAFTERMRPYSSPAEILADPAAGISDTDPEYVIAAALEANGLRNFALGRVDALDADWGVALDAVVAESNDFYGVTAASRTKAEVLAVAAKTLTHGKLYFAATEDADVVTSATDDVASELVDDSNFRVVVCYHSDAATEAIDGGLAAAMCRVDWDTESTTATAKQLAGVAIDSLTTTERTNALAKRCTIYERVQGLGWTYPGQVASGHYIDDIIIRDWYEARANEDLAQLLANVSAANRKIPGNARGAAQVESVFRKRHELGVRAGHFEDLRPDGSEYFVFTWSHNPTTRRMTVTVREKLAGGVHGITVTANLETSE